MEPVVAETYDEVVFTDPNEPFYKQLMGISIVPRIQSTYPEIQCVLSQFTDNEDFLKLLEALRFMDKSVAAVKERMKLATEEMEQVDAALKKVQEAKNTAAEFQRKQKATLSTGNAAKRAKPNSYNNE
jgi:Sec-independent protein translocase protein TatA